ncbi:MAG: radical SAM protein [Desulfamplus sp.]|nr:radical SAM protein [Desulfamplus sp.]
MKNLSSCNLLSCCCEKDASGDSLTILLPVAVKVNARIRYSPVNPSVPSAVMGTDDVIAWLEQWIESDNLTNGFRINAVQITGYGDPLAEIERTLEIANAVHTKYPWLTLSVRTLGIDGDKYAAQLHAAGVSRIELEINAVDTAHLEKIYAWIRPGHKTLRLEDAANILLKEQRKALKAFDNAGVAVSVITTLYPHNNEDHIEEIAEIMAELGSQNMVILPYRPEDGTDIFLPSPDEAMMEEARKLCAQHIAVKKIGLTTIYSRPVENQEMIPQSTKERPNVAVVSTNGIDIDLHLGQARKILIYGPRKDGLVSLLETRSAPESGSGDSRWLALAGTLHDCFALLTASAGENPRKVLSGKGIRTLITEDNIESTVEVLYG